MATIRRFEDLEIWQSARKLNIEVYPVLQNLLETKHYKFKEQLDASAGSIMDNIAEGFERDGSKEFRQFLAISKGSLGEVRSQLYRAFDRDIIKEAELETLQSQCKHLGSKISKFIIYLNQTDYKGNKFKNN